MPSVRLVSSLTCALALCACKRQSEPPPGPGVITPSVQASSSSVAAGAEEPHSTPNRPLSPHDRDMPDKPPPRPPSDNAKLIRASQILIAYLGAQDAPPSVTRDKDAAQRLAERVALEAHAGANFGELVSKYSDDLKTKADDGRLGQISRTQMAKPFTDAAFNLMVKEVTREPVETASGFHIIKRTE